MRWCYMKNGRRRRSKELASDNALDPDELAGDILCVFYFIDHMFPNKICDKKKKKKRRGRRSGQKEKGDSLFHEG